MKALYVKGTNSDADGSTVQQLRALEPELEVTVVASSADALTEIRRTAGWHALLISPGVPQNETLALIASVRRDKAPIAIVPVVDEAQQDVFAAAVASGADDVLLRRGQTLINVAETLTRIRQSPHLFPAEQRRRLTVLYAGRDTLVWNLLDQVPFVKAEKVNIGPDGNCPVRTPGATDGSLRCDAVVIDEQPGEAHPLQVLKSVKAQASDLPVIVLSSTGAGDIGTAALELGADDTVLKTGIFRRRLVATLRRVHQRIELATQQTEIKAREGRLRQIVENVPTGITVIGADGVVLAMNAAALRLFGAGKPRDIVGRDFRQLVAPAHHDSVTELIHRVSKGESTAAEFTGLTLSGEPVPIRLEGVVLERDARGGRGVVASVSSATGNLPLGGVSTTGELAELRESVEVMARREAELQDASTRDRAAWDEVRQSLEDRIEAAERLVAEHAPLASRLDDLTSDLADAREAADRERETLRARIAELESTSAEAATAQEARTDAERALAGVREELRQALTAHDEARAEWQAKHDALDIRVREAGTAHAAQADQIAGLAALEAEVRGLRATLASEREAASARQAQLETELRQAREALWTEHGERDTAREAFEAELGAIRQALSQERSDWARTREDLASQSVLATERIAALEHDLAARQAAHATEQQAVSDRQEAERLEWQSTRSALDEQARLAREHADALERDLASMRAQLDLGEHGARERFEEERRAWNAERQHLQSEMHAITQAADAARAELEALRASFEATEREARERVEAQRLELESARAQHDAEHQNARQRHDAERQEWEGTRARLEGDVLGARAAHDAGRQIWDSLRAGLEDDLHRTRDEWQSATRDWDHARDALNEQHRQAHDRAEALQQELNAAREALGAAEAHARQMFEGEQQTWEAARANLESALADARAAHDTERWAWSEARSALEDRQRDAQDRADVLQQELQTVRDALAVAETSAHHAYSTLAAEQHALETTRTELEAALADARTTLDADRSAWTDARSSLEAELERARKATSTAHHQLDAERQALATALDQAREEAESLQRELEVTQSQLETERQEARHAAQRDQDVWETTQASLERELQDSRTASDNARRDYEARLAYLTTALQAAEAASRQVEPLQVALDAARAEILHTDASHASERAEWEAARHAWQTERSDVEAQRAAERDAWQTRQASLDEQLAEANESRKDQERLEAALDALRFDYATMVQSLAGERSQRDHDRRELEGLQAAVVEAERRRAELQREFEHQAREAADRLSHRETEHATRLKALQDDLVLQAQRVTRISEEAAHARAALQAEYLRASEAQARLVSSDLFAYAVTTSPGELVRCNDAFARLFGFADAPDALTRTAGRLFPGLSGRTALMARLNREGRVDQVEMCLERIDGEPVRIIESLTLLTDASNQGDDETLVEHLMVGASAAPDPEAIQARQLEEVGALTAAMMPDIETLVSTVHERGHELRRLLRDVEGSQADLDALVSLTSQINALVRQLATFSRRQVRAAETVDLTDAVTRTEPVLVRLVGDYIGFAAHLSPTPPVTVNRDDLDQLLTSMVTFARDLLPAGGSLVVEARPLPSTPDEGDGVQSPASATILAVTASGFGVQLPIDAPAVELVARRCGGQLRLTGEAGWMARLEVTFPRCGRVPKSNWNWAVDE